MQKEYELSGKPGNIYTIGILVGVITVFLCQFLYIFLATLNILLFLGVIIYCLNLYVLFKAQVLVSRLAKCRNSMSAMICGIILGFVAVYFNMSLFAYFIMSKYKMLC